MLGASGNALAVYHGAQISDDDISYVQKDISWVNYNAEYLRDKLHIPYARNNNDLDTNKNIVFLYPVEFNPHPGISYRPLRKNQFDAEWSKHIMITDRMGSTKLVLGANENEGFKYQPFGKQIPRDNDDQRTAYIGKELDTESEMGDHGVRKVDYELGRFTTIDPLWEKYYAWSPYQYSMNNPISFLDENGKWAESAPNVYHHFKNYDIQLIMFDKIRDPDNSSTNGFHAIGGMNFNQGVNFSNGFIGLNGSKFDYAVDGYNTEGSLASTLLHETVHDMGYGEFGAHAAQLAAGLITRDQIASDLWDDDRMSYICGNPKVKYLDESQRSQAYDTYQEMDRNDPKQVNAFIQKMIDYGNTILGK